MNSVVIYASHAGNTRAIAEAIAGALESCGPVRLLAASDVTDNLPAATDLLVIGSPTEGHRALPEAVQLFDRLAPDALTGIATAAFDTRLRWPRWLAGSAGVALARRLRRAGSPVIAPPECFFVTREPALVPGELARATRWAAGLAVAVQEPTTTGGR